MEFLENYWWALWAVPVAAFIVWRRLAERGGDEPLLRRIVYVSRPVSDPRSRRYVVGLPVRLLKLVFGGLLLVMLALLLQTWFG
ncbi:MAG: hypothetical protein MEQ07_11320 [Aquimonas sp.]|nr:hypothetical protein [Aquimonas sp.]